MAYLISTKYDELYNLLHERRFKVIGYKTEASLQADDDITIWLHGLHIVTLRSWEVVFSMAGCPSQTTRDRINQFLPRHAYLTQRKNIQYLNLFQEETEIDPEKWYHVNL